MCQSPKLPDEIEELSFRETVVPEIAKLLASCTRKEESRPNLRRVYRVDIDGVPHLGATDARSAMVHKCPNAPEGFSYDPTLIPLHDIVGYKRTVIEETGSTVNYYTLKDGTTVSETLPPAEVPAIVAVLAKFKNLDRNLVLSSAALSKLVEDISLLGLGSGDSHGGVVTLTGEGAIPIGDLIRFSLPTLVKFAQLGGDFCVYEGENAPAIATCGSTTYMAMPMTIKQEGTPS